MATYAIGDIQGCDDEFARLLDVLRFDPGRDRLWLVGDLVNRGPNSAGVLRRARALGDAVTLVLGNHDLHLLALAYSRTEPLKAKDTLADVLTAPDRDELLGWLRRQPLLHHDAALGYTMIHAGLPPQWDLATARRCAGEVEAALRDEVGCRELFENMYGDHPNRWSESLSGHERFITNALTRLRYCRDDGTLELKLKGPIAKAPAHVYPWFRVPDRRSRGLRIVCGHWSALGFHHEDGVLSIDTGCVWGQHLCAVRLDAATVEPVLVPCSSGGLVPGIDG
jgi:bis(5'-nucleosyl)-tetraphosphatase (symmetrical)